MDAAACPFSCRCWARVSEPFTTEEQNFLEAATSKHVPTLRVVALMKDMALRVGQDRLGYLLSVPVAGKGMVHTPWIRLCQSWTPLARDALVFTGAMLRSGACCALAYQLVHPSLQKGWKKSSGCGHPGRADMRGTHKSAVDLCLSEGLAKCAKAVWQWRRWDKRVARRLWLS